LTAHKDEYRSGVRDLILLSNGHLASCGDDKTVKIWGEKPSNLKCLHTFSGHLFRVLSLCELHSNILVSDSRDKTLRFWDYVKYKQIKTILDWELGDTYAIAKINEKEIAVGSSSSNYGHIRIYNWVDSIQKKCTHVLKGHKSFINSLILTEDKTSLISCSED